MSGTSANYGVLLEEDPVGASEFRSSEKELVESRPKLDLCYVPQSGACTGVLGLPRSAGTRHP